MEREEIELRFNYHKVCDLTQNIMEGFRKDFKTLANDINSMLHDGREKSLVMTKLEEAQFWLNASLARNE